MFDMGNEVSVASPQTTGDLLRDLGTDFPDLVPQAVIGNFKLLKVVQCSRDVTGEGIVVKVFFGGGEMGAEMSARVARLSSLRHRFTSLVHANVVPFESAELSARSAIYTRPFFSKNLHDRLFSHPHLSNSEKLWYSFQILCGLAQLHSAGVAHGGLRLENIFVSGSGHLAVGDMALFKPVRFLADDPVAAFSLYYESDLKKKKCFVAPERFVEFDNPNPLSRLFESEPFSEALERFDAFSAGCCFLELFLDGAHVLDLPELLMLRREGSMPDGGHIKVLFDRLKDEKVKSMIRGLIERDPLERISVSDLLTEASNVSENSPYPSDFANLLVPLFFVCSQGVYTQPDFRMLLLRANLCHFIEDSDNVLDYDRFTVGEVLEGLTGTGLESHRENGVLKHPILSRLNGTKFWVKLLSLWRDGSALCKQGSSVTSIEQTSELYSTLDQVDDSDRVPLSSECVGIFLNLLASTAAASSLPRSKQIFIQVAEKAARTAGDECISDLLIPYLHDLAVAGESGIRGMAARALGKVVRELNKSEAGLFSDYLFPALLSGVDPATALPVSLGIAEDAVRLACGKGEEHGADFDKKLTAIRMFVERALNRVTSSKNSLSAKFSLMGALMRLSTGGGALGGFEKVLILPAISAMAQDSQWVVRAGICRYVAGLQLSPLSLEVGTLSTLLTNLEDADERVLISALLGTRKFARACIGPSNHPLKRTKILVTIAEKLFPLTFHPNRLLIGKLAQEILTEEIAHLLPQAEQLVFLRSVLGGARCLDELGGFLEAPISYSLLEEAAFKFDRSGFPFESRKQVEFLGSYLNSYAKGTASNSIGALPEEQAPLTLPITHTLEVKGLNPQVSRGIREFSTIAALEDFLRPGGNSPLWRNRALALPASPLEVGALSRLDGSFCSLYAGSERATIQREYLSTLPGVSKTEKSTEPHHFEGTLLASLYDFSDEGAAVSVDVTDDGRLLAAVNKCGTVRVYRLGDLDKDAYLSASKAFQIQGQRVRKMRVLRNSKSAAIPTKNSLAIYRLDLPTSDPIARLGSDIGDTIDLVQFDSSFESCVFAVTDRGRLVGWDYRSSRLACNLSLPVMSLASSLAVGKDCLSALVGYHSGKLSVLDLRSAKTNRTFKVVGGTTGKGIASVSAIAASANPGSVWIGTGTGDIAEMTYEAYSGGVKQYFMISDSVALGESHAPVSLPHLLACEMHSSVKGEFEEITKHSNDMGCRRILPFGSSVISAHNDGVIRSWQPFIESSSSFPVFIPKPASSFMTVGSVNILAQQTPQRMAESNMIAEEHRDAVLDCCLASLQNNMLVSTGRDGIIKIWR